VLYHRLCVAHAFLELGPPLLELLQQTPVCRAVLAAGQLFLEQLLRQYVPFAMLELSLLLRLARVRLINAPLVPLDPGLLHLAHFLHQFVLAAHLVHFLLLLGIFLSRASIVRQGLGHLFPALLHVLTAHQGHGPPF
jgi:hypothetical protein